MKIANLSEEEFREKEAQIIKDESEELKDIKLDIVHKLSMSNINGFESFEVYARRNFDETVFDMEDDTARQEVASEYKNRQMWVLEKLLKLNYFQKAEPTDLENLKLGAPEGPHTDLWDKPGEGVINEEGYQGREKKLTSVKLSKYVDYYEDSVDSDKKHSKQLEELVPDHIFMLNDMEVLKVINSKNHKTYYIESEIRDQYNSLKTGLVELYEKIKNQSMFGYKDLTEKELMLLINASSFSLNSIHFKVKFDKSDFILAPEDIVYLINKLDLNEPANISQLN